jgi:hypothetical protein
MGQGKFQIREHVASQFETFGLFLAPPNKSVEIFGEWTTASLGL